MKQGNLSEKGLSTRDRIVREARTTLVDRGYDGLVLRELSDCLGIKLGNLQYYFKTKDLLALEVMRIEAEQDLKTLDIADGDPKVLLSAYIENLFYRWRGSSGVLFSMLTTLSMHKAEFKKLYRSIYNNFYRSVECLLLDLRPGLPEDEIALKARLITALIDGSSLQVNVGNVQKYLAALQSQAEKIALD